MSNTMPESTTSSDRKPGPWDRKPGPWDSTRARAEADMNNPDVVTAVFDAGREYQRDLSAYIAAGGKFEESDVEDIYAVGRKYELAVIRDEAARLLEDQRAVKV